MFAWITVNLGTILVCFVLTLIVGAIVASLVKDRRAGTSSCSCAGGCAGCPSNGMCHRH